MSYHIKLFIGTLLTVLVLFGYQQSRATTATSTAVATVEATLISESPGAVAFGVSVNNLTHSVVELGDISFDRFAVEGETPAGQEGWPEVPAVVRYVLMPPQSGVSLKVVSIKSRTLSNINLYPRQPEDFTKLQNPAMVAVAHDGLTPVMQDPASLTHAGFLPEETVRLGRPTIMRGFRMVPVVINPLRYNPVTKELVIIDDIELALDFTSAENQVNIVENPGRRKPSRMVHAIISDMVVNPPAPLRDGEAQNGSVVYVMGTGGNWDAAYTEIKPLVEWRRRMGWSAAVIKVNNTNDRNVVKAAILDAYNKWENPPEHVILVGDTDGAFPMAYFDMRVGAAYPYESDQPFIQLEGDGQDYMPDAAVGRFIVFGNANASMLKGIVEKTIKYESNPALGDANQAGWFKRGIVAAVSIRSGISSIDMCRLTKDVMLRNGYNQVNELYWTPADQEPGPRNFVRDNVNGGISLLMFRGHALMGDRNNRFEFNDVDALTNHGLLPFALIVTCNTGDYGEKIYNPVASHAERFNYHPTGGAIGSVGCAGATHTAYNNAFCTGVVNAMFGKKITQQGWAFHRGKIDLLLNYQAHDQYNHPENRNDPSWRTHYHIINLFGDPAVDLYTDTPRQLTVTHPTMNIGSSHLEVIVQGKDDEEPVEGAQVCLYKAGANDGVAFQVVGHTDANGRVVLHTDPAQVLNGDKVMLTVTGHNLFPYLKDFNISQAQNFIGAKSYTVDDDANGLSVGNGDGKVNPTETIELTIAVNNYGANKPNGAMSVTLKPAPEQAHVLSMVQGRDKVDMDSAPNSGASANATFVFEVHGGFPAEQRARFDMTVDAGGSKYYSAVELPVTGVRFEFVSLAWTGGKFERAGSGQAKITIKAVGDKSPIMSGQLISLTKNVNTSPDPVAFAAMDSGKTKESANAFTIGGDPFHLSGSRADLALVLTSDSGVQDTVFLSTYSRDAKAGEPIGPDPYGYIGIDDKDTSWFVFPEYEWIEIKDKDTTLLKDTGADQDKSVVMPLPFKFKHYGEVYDSVTISSNGWIAVGSHRDQLAANNRRMGSGCTVPGMIAPFWDDLITDNNSKIVQWYDADKGLYIVEWYSCYRYRNGGKGETETFQVILHDPRMYPTFTGDGNIIFQYLEVTNGDVSANQAWDSPFATVGIASGDLSSALEYTYWGDYTPGAEPLAARRAILFTTAKVFASGVAHGHVTDAKTGAPVSGALVATSFNYFALTDDNGYYCIPDMLDAAQLDSFYTFKASRDFYNSTEKSDIEIIPDDTITVNFALLHPEFDFRWVNGGELIEKLVDTLYIGPDELHEREHVLRLTNTGNGPLDFTSKFEFRDIEARGVPGRDKPWDVIWDLDITKEIPTGNKQMNGVVMAGGKIIVAGGGSRNDNIPARFYRFTREGALIDSIDQPWIDTYGVRDMVFDGQYIWSPFRARDAQGNNLTARLYKFDLDMQLVDSLTLQDSTVAPRCLAYDHVNKVFYVSGSTRFIRTMDVNGNFLDSHEPAFMGETINKWGLAWYEAQPDSFKLLIYSNIGQGTDPEMLAYNPVTKDIKYMGKFVDKVNDRPMGIDVTGQYNSSMWTLLSIISNSEADRLVLRELEPNTSWISYDPIEGSIEPGEHVDIKVNLNNHEKELGYYYVFIAFEHTADPGWFDLPVSLEVDTVKEVGVEFEQFDNSPTEFGLRQNYPNPFNPSTRIRFGIETAGATKLTVWDINGRLVATLIDQPLLAGSHSILFHAGNLPNGVYFNRLESGGKVSIRKMVLVK